MTRLILAALTAAVMTLTFASSASAVTLPMYLARGVAADVAARTWLHDSYFREVTGDSHAVATEWRVERCWRTGGRTVWCRDGYLVFVSSHPGTVYCHGYMRLHRATHRSRVRVTHPLGDVDCTKDYDGRWP